MRGGRNAANYVPGDKTLAGHNIRNTTAHSNSDKSIHTCDHANILGGCHFHCMGEPNKKVFFVFLQFN